MVALVINLHMVLIAKGEKLQDFPPIHHAKGMDGGWYVFALSFYTFSWLTWQWVNGGTWMPSPPLAYTEPESGTKGNKVRVGSPKTLAELDLTRLFQDLYRLNAAQIFVRRVSNNTQKHKKHGHPQNIALEKHFQNLHRSQKIIYSLKPSETHSINIFSNSFETR